MSDHADTIRQGLASYNGVKDRAASAALDALLAERQQAIEALREIAGYGKYLEESGGAKLKLPKAVTIARSALAKLGEKP